MFGTHLPGMCARVMFVQVGTASIIINKSSNLLHYHIITFPFNNHYYTTVSRYILSAILYFTQLRHQLLHIIRENLHITRTYSCFVNQRGVLVWYKATRVVSLSIHTTYSAQFRHDCTFHRWITFTRCSLSLITVSGTGFSVEATDA